MTPTPTDDLVRALQTQSAVFVVGSGCTISATGGLDAPPTTSWKGLLESGLHEVKNRRGVSDKWLQRELQKLTESFETDDLTGIIEVATSIENRLEPGSGDWAAWLRHAIGELSIVDNTLPSTILSLSNGLILTTNYDDILSRAADSAPPPIPWSDERKVARAARGVQPGIIHLHGHWDTPESVVLGQQKYNAVSNSPHTQAIQHAIATLNSLIFVGFGGGLADPNFGPLLKWMTTFWRDEHRHFRLVLSSELESTRSTHSADQRISVISYGGDYDDLPKFLSDLKKKSTRK